MKAVQRKDEKKLGKRLVKAAREGRAVHVNPLDEGDFKEF